MTELTLKSCDPSEVKKKLSAGSICLIDVREAVEYAAEKIEKAVNHPLSDFDRIIREIPKDREIILTCKSGRRSEKAAEKLMAAGLTNVQTLAGGIEAWKSAGFPVQTAPSKVWALDRQVRFTAGLFVLLGLLGAWLIHPAWIALSAFIACGLIFSAVTDTCGMAMMLAKMPWNTSKKK